MPAHVSQTGPGGAPDRGSLRRPALSAAVPELERELKFSVPPGRVSAVRHWLRTACLADAQFPSAVVWTVYYDTPGVQSLDEKRNSDYLKTKMRVRWYAADGRTPSGPAFVELKFRIGSRRGKTRVTLPWTADDLAGRPLTDPLFRDLPAQLRAEGVIPGAGWCPVLQLRYHRERLVEPASRARISLDDAIAVEAVNPRHLSALSLGPLPVAVLEVKSRHEALPPRLHALTHLGARKCAFSKYLAVYQHVRRTVF